MSTIHYELGVRVRRRNSLMRAALRRRSIITTVIVFGILSLGLLRTTHLISHGDASSVVDHKQNQARAARKAARLAEKQRQELDRANWLSVQPVVSATPTATPSTATGANSVSSSIDLAVPRSQSPSLGVQQPTAELESATPGAVSVSPNPMQIPPSEIPAIPSNTTVPPIITMLPRTDPEPLTAPTTVSAAPTTTLKVAVIQPQLPTINLPTPMNNNLDNPIKKDIAMQLVSSAENSSLDWKAQYTYLEDIGDGRGYTGGIIGFCSGTGDMLELIQYYTKLKPNNPLASYIPALQKVDGTASHAGLGTGYEAAWQTAASDPVFQRAQNDERDRVYFNPAVSQAKADGLRALGQFIYYDAIVMHGPR